MSEHDSERRVRAWLEGAHRADRPPPFGRTREAARRRRTKRGPLWALVPALAAALLIIWNVRPRPTSGPAPHEIQSVEWNAPLDFLLQTPGSELLRAVPTFDTDRSLP